MLPQPFSAGINRPLGDALPQRERGYTLAPSSLQLPCCSLCAVVTLPDAGALSDQGFSARCCTAWKHLPSCPYTLRHTCCNPSPTASRPYTHQRADTLHMHVLS